MFEQKSNQIVGTLDGGTCERCGELDGAVFPMSEYNPGSTAPPFHPWCRCCTAPYFEDMQGFGERTARGLDGKTYRVPKNMTYREWKKQQEALQKAGGGLAAGKAGETNGYSVIKSVRAVEYNNAVGIRKSFDDFAEKYVQADIEYAKIITDENKEYLVKGMRSAVGIDLVGERLKGAYVIHNHPDIDGLLGDCFSRADFAAFFEYGIKEMQVISGLGRYSMVYDGEYISSAEAVKMYKGARREFLEKAFRGAKHSGYEQLEIMKILRRNLDGLIFKEIG